MPKKATDLTVSQELKDDARFLITQEETENGETKERLRRAGLDALHRAGGANYLSASGYLQPIPVALTPGNVNARTGYVYNESEYWEITSPIIVAGHKYLRYLSARTSGSVVYGLAFYDAEGDYISGVTFDVLDESKRNYFWKTTAIPAAAQTCRFTYWNAAYRTNYGFPPVAAYFADDYDESLNKEVRDFRDDVEGTSVPIYHGDLSAGTVNARTGQVINVSDFYVKTVPISVAGHRYLRYRAPRLKVPYKYGMAFFREGYYDGSTVDTEHFADHFISGKVNPYGDQYGYESVTVRIPDSAAWVRVTYWNQNQRTAFNAPPLEMSFIDDYDNTVEWKSEERIQTALYGTLEPIEVGSMDNGNVDATTGKVNSSSYYIKTKPIDVEGHSYLRYRRCRPGATFVYGLAFYSSGYYDGATIADNDDVWQYYISGYTNPKKTEPGIGVDIATVRIPDNAKWARVCYWKSTYNVPNFEAWFADDYPTSLEGSVANKQQTAEFSRLTVEAAALGLHTIPTSDGQLNLVKRARQMTDIRWTPAVDLPRMDMSGTYYLGVFKAGVEYRGLPYVRTTGDSPAGFPCDDYGLTHFYVGNQGKSYNGNGTGGVSIETFITAIQNPRSYICREYNTENINSNHYGIYYGTVCSAIASYIFNLPEVETTSTIIGSNHFTPVMPYQGGAATLIQMGTAINKLELGDLLNTIDNPGHSMMVSDIIRNDNGEITHIEISEATPVGNPNQNVSGDKFGGLCRRVGWQLDRFLATYGAKYAAYHPVNIDDIPYVEDNFVSIDNDFNWQHNDKLQVMPYEGSGFRYRREQVTGGWRIISPYGGIKLLIDNDHRKPIFTPGQKDVSYSESNTFYFDKLIIVMPDGGENVLDVSYEDTEYILFPDLESDIPTGKYKAYLWKDGTTRKAAACTFDVID